MKRLLVGLIALFFFASSVLPAYAVQNPFAVSNNKIGIHILFDSELEEAAKLVNSSGGDWGYVTIPIQSGDRDMKKWQTFMDKAREYHLIPIIRLATEGDYFNTKVWRKPRYEDILDFSNFLDSLQWPTKNRYIIVFNEVNRGDEWGGYVDPNEYAQILNYAVTAFKSHSQDFFIISAGLDNAAPNEAPFYMNQYDFMRRMHKEVPGIFNQVDGIASHAYPNPGFAQPPSARTSKSITSFQFERSLLQTLSMKTLPIFITETGWRSDVTDENLMATYLQEALSTVWQDEQIVAITPFLLRADQGGFEPFTFIKAGAPTKQYVVYKNFPKQKGAPTLMQKVLGENSDVKIEVAVKTFPEPEKKQTDVSIMNMAQTAFSWIMGL